MAKKNKELIAYTDGSVRDYGTYGSWAAILIDGKKETEYSGYEFNTKIGRMELMGVLGLMESFKDPVRIHIYSDSTYVVNCVKKWIVLWRKHNYCNLFGKPAANVDLLERIYEQMQKHKIKIDWVKAHAGNKYNEKADKLATSITADMVSGKIKRI
jgi:ribonuclease HI